MTCSWLQEHSHAVREAQRAAVAGILATMEEHFSSSGTKRPASSQQQQPQSQPQLKRSKLLDLGDMDFGSDASSDVRPSETQLMSVDDCC